MVHSTAELLKHRYLGLDSEGSKVQNFWRSLLSPSPWIIFSANQPGLSCFSKHYHRRSTYVFISRSLPRTVNQVGLSVKQTLAPLNRAWHSPVSWIISMSNLLSFFKPPHSKFFWSLHSFSCFSLWRTPIVEDRSRSNPQAAGYPGIFLNLIFFVYFLISLSYRIFKRGHKNGPSNIAFGCSQQSVPMQEGNECNFIMTAIGSDLTFSQLPGYSSLLVGLTHMYMIII